jgi:hypothetical protein
MATTTDYWIQVYQSRGLNKLESELNRVANGYGRLEGAAMRSQRIGNSMMAVGALAAVGIARFGKASIEAAANVQATRTGFATLLGSQQKAVELYSKIEKFSLVSPLNNAETAKSAQLLLATGTAGDKVIEKLHAVGNAASAAGGGQPRFNGILMAMAKLENRSVASRQQLNQIAIRGVPVQKILQKELGLTADQVADIGHQALTGAQVAEALYRGMNKIGGGKAMENLNKTYLGQLSQMEDATQQLEASVGELVLPDATKFVGGLASAAGYLRDISKEHPRLTRVFLGIAGGGALALIAAGQFFKWKNIILSGKLAAQGLARANKDAAIAQDIETAAEIAKLPVGVAETAMHHRAAIATLEHAAANVALGGSSMAPMLPGAAGMAGAGLPMLPAAGGAATGAAEAGAAAGAGAAGSAGASGAAAGAAAAASFGAKFKGIWNRQILSDQALGELYEGGVSPLSREAAVYGSTVGNAATAVGVGAAAGYSVYDTYSNKKNNAAVKATTGIDVGEGGATAMGVGMGVGVGALTLVAPEFVLPIAAAVILSTAIQQGFNRLVFDKQDKAAETGNGAENKEIYGDKMGDRLKGALAENAKTKSASSFANVADVYNDMSLKAKEAGDEDAQMSNGRMAIQYRALAKRATQGGTVEGDIAQQRAMVAGATNIPDKERFLATWEQQRRNGTIGPTYGQPGGNPEWEKEVAERERMYGGRQTPEQAQRSAAQDRARVATAYNITPNAGAGGNTIEIRHTVTLPPGPGDVQARRNRSNTMTPAPV